MAAEEKPILEQLATMNKSPALLLTWLRHDTWIFLLDDLCKIIHHLMQLRTSYEKQQRPSGPIRHKLYNF